MCFPHTNAPSMPISDIKPAHLEKHTAIHGVLELQEDGKLTISDDPPVVFGYLDGSIIQQSGLQTGCLLRFTVGEGGLVFVDGKLERADLQYLGKIMFQYSVRHSPLRIDDLLGSFNPPADHEKRPSDIEMDG